MEKEALPMSKKARKKQLKRERLEQLKAEYKATRKQKQKEKKERQRNDPSHFKNRYTHTKKEDKQRLRTAMESGVRLVIDLSFVHLMTTKEIGSLCRQLTSIYAENKRSLNPFHLYFTSFNGVFKDTFEQYNTSYRNWIVDIQEDSYLEVFAKEHASIVYLTADAVSNISTETMKDGQAVPFDKDCILVVGGLIDRNRHKNVCFKEASKHGIRTAQLPLHLLKTGLKTMKVLTTNQCAEILLRYNERLDWESSVEAIVPKRKRTDTAPPPIPHSTHTTTADPSNPIAISRSNPESVPLDEASDE